MKLRTIELNQFPINRAIYEILKEQTGRKERIQNWINEVKKRFPSADGEIGNVGMKYLMTWIGLNEANSSYEDFLTFFGHYNNEEKIITPATANAKKELAELLKPNSEDKELIKLLKEIANDSEQQELLTASIDDPQGGVAWLFFLLDTLKDFYLNKLPTYINVIKLEEVKEQLKPVLSDLFATLYSSYVKVEVESDLDQLKNDTNANLEKIKKIISDYRDSKKPTEPDKPDTPQDNTELDNLKIELTDLYAYLDGVLEKQAQQPVYILTEEPEQMTREGGKPNPNYLIFEEELLKHPIIKDKVQKQINKRKFSTPIAINKDKPSKPDDRPNITQQEYQNLLNNQEKHKPEDLEKHKPEDLKPADYDANISKLNEWQNTFLGKKPSEVKGELESKPADQQPQKPTPEQISKADQYDQFASLFPDNKVPSNIKELWQSLNNRPNISQGDYNNLLQQAQQAGVKPEELKLLLKDNWDYLKGHIDILTNIIKRAVPTSTPNLSDSGSGSSSNQSQKPDSTTTSPSSSESKPKSSGESETPPDQISQ